MNKGVQRLLTEGETVRWEVPALRTLGRVTVAGTLSATERQLLFAPNRLNLRRRPPWNAPLSEIRRVNIAERSLEAFSGACAADSLLKLQMARTRRL